MSANQYARLDEACRSDANRTTVTTLRSGDFFTHFVVIKSCKSLNDANREAGEATPYEERAVPDLSVVLEIAEQIVLDSKSIPAKLMAVPRSFLRLIFFAHFLEIKLKDHLILVLLIRLTPGFQSGKGNLFRELVALLFQNYYTNQECSPYLGLKLRVVLMIP